tara:strand:- start:6265 stop:6453 length:189 start_codon:yes stop_codon:yes gene_type:complete
MIKYIKKLLKKQKLLEKYKKGEEQIGNHIHLLSKFNWSKEDKHYFEHQFYCELKCYNRLRKL